MEVLVVGSYNRDMQFLVETLPKPGETLMAEYKTGHGGKGSNQCIAAAKLAKPGSVVFLGSVGDDEFGREVKQHYEKLGIPAIWIPSSAPTGSASITVDKHAENIICVALGSNLTFGADVLSLVPSIPKIVLLQLEISLKTVHDCIDHYAGNGITRLILNPAPYLHDLDIERVKKCEAFIPNETEFESLTGETLHIDGPLEALHEKCRSLDIPVVIVTLGSKGVFFSSKTGKYDLIPACKVTPVDTSGAGDAFCGALVAELSRHLDDIGPDQLIPDHVWINACKFGNKAAGLSVTKHGTSCSYPSWEEVCPDTPCPWE